MKILLIQPAKAQKTIGGEDVFIYEPLALEYLASGVKGEHDVKILDMISYCRFIDEASGRSVQITPRSGSPGKRIKGFLAYRFTNYRRPDRRRPLHAGY